MSDPMTDEQLAGMGLRIDAHDGADHYRYTVDGIEYDGHWKHDMRRLLNEVGRLRSVLDQEVEGGKTASTLACMALDKREEQIDGLVMELEESRKEVEELRAWKEKAAESLTGFLEEKRRVEARVVELEEQLSAAGMPHTPAPGAREYMVVVPSMIGNLEDWRTTYHTDGVRKATREEAIAHGLEAEGHDDWLIAIVSGDTLLGLAWQHEDRDDAEEIEEAAAALGLTADPEMPRPAPGADEDAFDRGFGKCPHCLDPEVTRCHDCGTAIYRPRAAAEGWRMDHLGGFGCIAFCPRCRDDAEMPRPAPQPLASGPQSVPGQSDKGTGVSVPENPVQEADPGESIADYIGRTTAEQAAALRPVHYREAAEHLESVARDEEER